MTENNANIYSIAYRDCKEVSDNVNVNEEFGKLSTILFYIDEILEALKIASEIQTIGTVEEFKALKEKGKPKKPKQYEYYKHDYFCPACGRKLAESVDDNCNLEKELADYCSSCGQRIDCLSELN